MTNAFKEVYDKMEEMLDVYNISAEELLRLFTQYHGMRLLSSEFFEHLEEEGYKL